jgi:hypothetical protein
MSFKKLAIASATALMFVGAAQAADVITIDTTATTSITSGTLADLETLIPATSLVTAPAVNVTAGAVNLAIINGAIDISGTNVALSSMANNVSATATATATTSTADAYAIAGAKLSTTVIGAMNSATVEIASRSEDLASSAGTSLGIESLAAMDGSINVGTPGVGAATTADALTAGLAEQAGVLATAASDFTLAGLTTDSTNTISSKINELQDMNVFNTTINAATLDAGIRVAAAVDTNAWFLNPQTGVVNLSNVAMATTAIGAMNSSVTRLGAGSLSPTVIVK